MAPPETSNADTGDIRQRRQVTVRCEDVGEVGIAAAERFGLTGARAGSRRIELEFHLCAEPGGEVCSHVFEKFGTR